VEDSRTNTINNDALIEEMMRDAEKAAEPGDIVQDPVVNRGSEDAPFPAVLKDLSSAGYVYVYDTRTAERSIINRNMLRSALRKVRPDGSTVFTIHKPAFEPARGTYKCMLHKDAPNRKHYDEMGFATCPKANLRSPYQVEQHMKHRHKQEYAAIEAERLRNEKQEDRDFQKNLMREVKTRGGKGK